MYAVSSTWAAAQDSFLAPEGLIEISCYVPALNDVLVYTKRDLLSFSHQMTGCLVSGELPKNHITFSLDNSDDKWNPNNPKGMERYLSDRLKVTLRYGYIINGREEWIPGGLFYLSEWRTSQNGLEANFTARDVFEYMIDTPYTGEITGTLYEVAKKAIEVADIPDSSDVKAMILGSSQLGLSMLGLTSTESVSTSKATKAVTETPDNAEVQSMVLGLSRLGSSALGWVPTGGVNISDELKKYSVSDIEYNGQETVAAILQKCANAAGCVMYQNRNGVLVIGKPPYRNTGYVIPKKLSYAYPEVDFSRPMKNVSVTYNGNEVVVYPFSCSGETQTLSNDFVTTKEQAEALARWVCDSLRSRQQISGEYRGDPRLDLFDVVSIENKYGTVAGVVLTDIKYTFSGAFRTTFSGYIRGSGMAVTVYCGENFAGDGGV